LAGSGDRDASRTLKEEFDRLKKGIAQPCRHLFQGRGLATDNLPSVFQLIGRLPQRNRVMDLEHRERFLGLPERPPKAKQIDYTGLLKKCKRRSRYYSL